MKRVLTWLTLSMLLFGSNVLGQSTAVQSASPEPNSSARADTSDPDARVVKRIKQLRARLKQQSERLSNLSSEKSIERDLALMERMRTQIDLIHALAGLNGTTPPVSIASRIIFQITTGLAGDNCPSFPELTPDEQIEWGETVNDLESFASWATALRDLLRLQTKDTSIEIKSVAMKDFPYLTPFSATHRLVVTSSKRDYGLNVMADNIPIYCIAGKIKSAAIRSKPLEILPSGDATPARSAEVAG